MSSKHYFIGLCIDVGTYTFIPLEFIKFKLDSVLMYIMFMSAMYCVCMHTFHSAHTYICIVYNSVKCVRYSYNHVNS